MKIRIIVYAILVALSGIHFSSKAQDRDVIDNISIALSSGSAQELTNFFNDVVELKIDGQKENYSKKQAEVI
ncbi:MAG: DUF4783 domain-containing protein, partial [Cyclobacteriaceae bacterium]